MSHDLLRRLDQIGESLATEPTARALLGLGSVGVELDRLDDHSDLDFFVIVDPGSKSRYLESLDWMSRVQPIEYAFLNTADGYKLMFDDGIFCEFAVFEPDELATVAYANERLVWASDRFDATTATPRTSPPDPPQHSFERLVGEALTNLYVGLLRDRRGERMAAFRMIQGHAVDRIMDLADHLEDPKPGHRDPFGNERRFEARHPGIAADLPRFMQGYERNGPSAAAILAFLSQHADVDPSMRRRVLELVEDASA